MCIFTLPNPALDFVYHVTHSRRRPSWKDYRGLPCSEILPTPLTTPKEERRQLAREALDRLAPVTEYRVDHERNFAGMKGAHGVTLPTFVHARYGINIKSDTGPATGMACVIRINHDDLERLDQLRAERRERNRDSSPRSRRVARNNMAVRFRLQFKLAITLCHETAHAVGYAVDEENLKHFLKERAGLAADRSYVIQRRGTNEPYFGRDPIAELGYAYEKHVFGGTVHLSLKPGHVLFFNKGISYMSHGEYPSRKYKKTCTRYVVSMFYICNRRRQIAWEYILSENGDVSSLYIQRIIGYKTHFSDPEFRWVQQRGGEEDLGWDSANSEEGYWREDEGESRRVSRVHADEVDPSCAGINRSIHM